MKHRRKVLIATTLIASMSLTACGKSKNTLKYQYNEETKCDELIGQATNLNNLYITKIIDLKNNPQYYITKMDLGALETPIILIGTDKKLHGELGQEPYGEVIYSIDLNSIMHYYNNSIAKDTYTNEEILEVIENLKNEETEILNNQNIYIKTK